MNVRIDDGCIGCGLCEGACPQVFRMGADGLAEVFGDANAESDDVRAAAEGCPVAVIVIQE